jgi:putative hydrolase of HD superfamily
MTAPRLEQQVRFLVEIDQLKEVLRQTLLTRSRRQENSAEHSWHLVLAAIVLAEHANPPGLDLVRTLKMVAIHDVVEIDAGDTYAYDAAHAQGQHEREAIAAARIFGLLPADQAAEIRALWDEFEARATPESRFANALDRFQAVLLNCRTGGVTWRQHGVTHDRVLQRLAPVKDGSVALWEYAVAMVQASVEAGHLAPAPMVRARPATSG